MATRLVSVVIDAAEPGVVARWWSAALGWSVTFEDDEEVDVAPPHAEDGSLELVFVPIEEPKVVKNRVHLDLASDSEAHQQEIVDRLIASGASPIDVGQGTVPWTVLSDPFGNELCVLEPRERHTGRGSLASIVVDAADPVGLANFWAAASGWTIDETGDTFARLRNPNGALPDLDLVRVDTERSVKNRVHLDVAPFADGSIADEVGRLEALGARPIDVGQRDVTWTVLADPEGNEFCVLTPR